jgi:hypothetical protein
MVRDLCQHGAEIEFRVEAVEFGRSNEAVYGSGAVATRVGVGEQIVLPVMQIFA